MPEARPIEDFWAHLKRNVYIDGWQAKNIDQLKKRISDRLKKIDLKAVQKLAESTIRRIDHVRRNGVR